MLRIVVNTSIPVSAPTILFMACHLSDAQTPDDIVSIVIFAASQEARVHQAMYMTVRKFSDFLTSNSVENYRNTHDLFQFEHDLNAPEEVFSDINMMETTNVYMIENADGTIICAVVRLGDIFYHLYPHPSGVLMAGPGDILSVCKSLMYTYPCHFEGCVRMLIQKK
ncbi:MAG: hypothetical protein AB7P49_00695 [Bdellovibrionales bacterium]